MPGVISPSEVQRYRSDGVLFPVRVISTEEAQRYRAACDALEAALGGKPRTVEVRQMHLHFRWAYELATHPRVLDAAEAVLGPNLLIWGTELFAKHPHDDAVAIAWHRDQPYMGFGYDQTTTAWIALADSNPANGCLRVIPKSQETSAHRAHNGQPGQPVWGETTTEDEAEMVDVVLRAGEMSLHDGYVLHGSGRNGSNDKRVGFTVRFVAPEAQAPAGKPPMVLARGRDDYQHFTLIEPTIEDESPWAVEAMSVSATRHLEKILQNLKLTSH